MAKKKSNKQIILEEARKAGLSGKKLDHFVAQMFSEAGGWRTTEENPNFRVSTMRKFFSKAKGMSDQELKKLSPYYATSKEEKQKRSKKFFDFFYGDRMGNDGEGYRYRGRGPIQLTGKQNYEKYGADPDKMGDLRHAAAASARYFADKVKDIPEDADVDEFSKAVNPGAPKSNLKKRKEIYNTLIEKKDELKAKKLSQEIERGPAMTEEDKNLEDMSDEELLASLSQEVKETSEPAPEPDLEAMSDEELLASLSQDVKGATEEAEDSALETFLVRGANAMAFDFGDEIAAGVESTFTTKTYDQALQENRDYLKRLEEANPNAALAGDITGAIGGSLAGGAALNAFKLGKALNVGKSLKNVMIGAGEGGLAALGKTEEDKLLDQLEDTVLGAGIGAGGAAIGSAIGKTMGGLKKEAVESGEELIDRSMGIRSKTMKDKVVNMMTRKGIKRDELYTTIKNIKLQDGRQVFNPDGTVEDLVNRLSAKQEEYSQAFQKMYNIKSNEIGEIIDPEEALSNITARFQMDRQVAEDLAFPRLESSFEQAADMVKMFPAMFKSGNKITLGQMHSNIKALERNIMKKYGVKSYYQLDDTVQKGLESARDYLDDTMRANLSDADYDQWIGLNKEFSIFKEYSKLAQKNNDYQNKGAIAGLARIMANSTFFTTGASMLNPADLGKALAVGTGMRAVAKSPGVNKVLGESLEKVGAVLSRGEALDEPMKRLVNAATRSVMDFEVELENESLRMDGFLPTPEEREAEVNTIKQSSLPVRSKLQFIEQAKQGVKPNYEQDVPPPVYKKPEFAPRDKDGKKIEDDSVMGRTQVRVIPGGY